MRPLRGPCGCTVAGAGILRSRGPVGSRLGRWWCPAAAAQLPGAAAATTRHVSSLGGPSSPPSVTRLGRASSSSGSSLGSSSTPRRRAAAFHASPRNGYSAWGAAVSVASNVVANAVRRATAPKSELDLARSIDPLRAVAHEMKHLTGNMRKLLDTGHPSLKRVARYYTQAEGKHIRPLVVLLMSRATAACPKAPPDDHLHGHHHSRHRQGSSISASISPLPVLADVNPSYSILSRPDNDEEDGGDGDPHRPAGHGPSGSSHQDILPAQRRLAEITELIHTATLLHDDVIDTSSSRRGEPSANLAFGNKMAVLAGDFLLGRASIALARIRNVEVVELLSTAIANLVEGEFMQLRNTSGDEPAPAWSEDALGYYLQKTYLKSAALISKSCRAAALLGGSDGGTVEAAYQYGKNLGLAFQLVDDLLDYTRSAAELGKPSGADLQLGLATAPLLFAWKALPELGALVGRRFEGEGDVERARKLVLESDGIEQTRALAQDYADRAVAALQSFPDSEAKDGLVEMASKTVRRRM